MEKVRQLFQTDNAKEYTHPPSNNGIWVEYKWTGDGQSISQSLQPRQVFIISSSSNNNYEYLGKEQAHSILIHATFKYSKFIITNFISDFSAQFGLRIGLSGTLRCL